MTSEQAEVVSRAAGKVMYGASGAGLIFGVSADVFAAIASVVVAIVFGFIHVGVMWYWKAKAHKLEVLRLKYQYGDLTDRRGEAMEVAEERRS